MQCIFYEGYLEQKLHKTQDMIVTLNRAVGRLIDYEENQNETLSHPEPEHKPEDVKEPGPTNPVNGLPMI